MAQDQAPSRRRRVFLHVGSPKTGTTFLQQVLWRQRDLAAEQGLLLPMDSFNDHFLASVDVRGLAESPNQPARAAGMWDRLVEQVLAWEGDSLISHELFAGATAEQAARAVASFPDDVEVHVVLTARDMVRQVPAEWQEHVKHRSAESFPAFVEVLRREQPGTWFWRVQDYPDLCRRWGGSLPSSQVHVVTVPPSGTDSSVLWGRFAGLVGLAPETFDLEGLRANVSLGYEQAELLRRVNAELGDRLPIPGPYPVDVKDFFAQRVLAGRPGTRFGLHGEDVTWAKERSARMAHELAELGVDVVGDLAELEAAETHGVDTDLESAITDERLLRESVAAVAALLEERRRLRAEVQGRRRPLKTRLARRAERSRAGRGLLRVRRWARRE